MFNPFKPPPAPPAFGNGREVPEKSASYPSKLFFSWLTPFLSVGFSRTLEKEDLWSLPEAHHTAQLTDKIEQAFFARCPPEKRPKHLQSLSQHDDTHDSITTRSPSEDNHDSETKGDVKNDVEKSTPHISEKKEKKEKKPKYDESLARSLHSAFFWRWWTAGILRLCADTLRTTTPLVSKVLLTWLTESYYFHRASPEQQAQAQASGMSRPKGIGYGIGLAFAIFIMQEVASLMINHYMLTTMTNGLCIRSGLIGNIFRKSLRLSGRARLEHSVGQITTMISTDTTRLDRFSAFAHNLWVAPVQILIGVGLLIGNLGYSALVGLGVLILGFPLQLVLVKIMFGQRMKGVKITDKRIRLTTEVLQGIRLIKFYAWEDFYISQISGLRSKEISTIRKSSMARSALIALVTLIPVLASILSFITYALSGHDLNIAIIFSSLQLFNVIRFPLIMFPVVLSAASDAAVAFGRIGKYLTAEELDEPYTIDQSHDVKNAIEVKGDFVWEVAGKLEGKFEGKAGGKGGRQAKKDGPSKSKGNKKDNKVNDGELPVHSPPEREGEEGPHQENGEEKEEKPFELKDLQMTIPKGSFVAIVGRVGSGKTSVLQALVGEMRKARGHVVFGGSVAYVPQTAWIKNATLRDNILFGKEVDEDRLQKVIKACSLEHDLEVLPNAEYTEIGEKGINLSGGQKARVSLARASYSDSDIVLLDDSLSAVDAFVGKALLENCILSGPLANRTRVLVTHSLHVLDKADYIYVMDNGLIIEQGTYTDLMNESLVFHRLMDEYGSLEQQEALTVDEGKPEKEKGVQNLDATTMKKGAAGLIAEEERETGAVSWGVYARYFRFAGGIIWGIAIVLLLTATQGASVSNNLFLGFWTGSSISGFRQGDYMAVYAALGIAQSLFAFMLSFLFVIVSLLASLAMFKATLRGVLRSPASFFDTTPIGRILSRLSKDQDTLDTELAMTSYQFLNTFFSVLGTIALVFYTFPYLGIIFAPLIVLYYMVSAFYRRSSVETKRLDSLMRSTLYASYSETLTGLATIRAYRTQDASIRGAEQGLDMENRAYYMTVAIQRWLAVRLDVFGNILVLGIGLFAAGFRYSVDPSKVGVVLSYTLGITQFLSDMVSQFAQNEQNMNAVERVLVYTGLQPEGSADTEKEPEIAWPQHGGIAFEKVELAYREGLPLVLKGISFEVKPGEKVGIVGRTGAGKSSLLQALFRGVELSGGRIDIDGLDIHDVKLDTLRSRLALVPQDSTLFLGTLRENIDPLGLRTDAELISVLQRAWLLPREGSDPVLEAKFSLDATVGDEGSNYSAGEKQLLALARALAKNSRIIILDEATSNVDVETDAKLQKTIQSEFANSTLLCIAHRLNTIAYYDRVLVMDGGNIAEYDTVLNLFDREGSIFRSLCDEAGLSRADILRIRSDVGISDHTS